MMINAADSLYIAGRETSLKARPLYTLSEVVDKKSLLGKRLHLNLQYNYTCTWELDNNRLYLKKVLCKTNLIPLEKIFTNYADKVYAHWFSRNTHAAFGGLFFNEEKEKWQIPYQINLSFQNGYLKDTSLICNKSAQIYDKWEEIVHIILTAEERIVPRGSKT